MKVSLDFVVSGKVPPSQGRAAETGRARPSQVCRLELVKLCDREWRRHDPLQKRNTRIAAAGPLRRIFLYVTSFSTFQLSFELMNEFWIS